MTRRHEAPSALPRPLAGGARAPGAFPHKAHAVVRGPLLRGARLLAGILLAAALAAAFAGCGYTRETPRLPGNAGTVAIGNIRNRTLTGAADVRLGHRLRALLLKHPGIQLATPEHSDLVLDIELTLLRVVRARNLATTSLTSVSYQLAGEVSVYDRRTSQYFVFRQLVQSISHLDFDSPTIETPGIRDEGLDDAIQSFATQVENLLFLSF